MYFEWPNSCIRLGLLQINREPYIPHPETSRSTPVQFVFEMGLNARPVTAVSNPRHQQAHRQTLLQLGLQPRWQRPQTSPADTPSVQTRIGAALVNTEGPEVLRKQTDPSVPIRYSRNTDTAARSRVPKEYLGTTRRVTPGSSPPGQTRLIGLRRLSIVRYPQRRKVDSDTFHNVCKKSTASAGES